MASYIIERWKASAQRQLCLPLLRFTYARSESIDADSLNSKFLQLLGRRSGGRPQRAVHPHAVTCQHCDTQLHTTLVGLEPATFRSLVRRATSSATEPTREVRGTSHIWETTTAKRMSGTALYDLMYFSTLCSLHSFAVQISSLQGLHTCTAVVRIRQRQDSEKERHTLQLQAIQAQATVCHAVNTPILCEFQI